MKRVAIVAGCLIGVMLIGLLTLVGMIGGSQPPGSTCGVPGGTSAGAVTGALPASVGAWSGEQIENAAAIINAGAEIGISRHGQTIGVMTAMGESGLRVLDYGDSAGPDSRGLFQQRANGAWGSLEDRMDPRISSLNFFRALMKVEGWESLPPTIAAHRTQINADPYHYEKFWDDAVEVAAALLAADGGSVQMAVNNTDGDRYGLGQVTPQLRNLVNTLAPMFGIRTVGGYRESATDMEGHPAGLAADFMVPLNSAGKRQGDALAAYARANAASLGVDYIIWYQRIWSTERADEGWRAMEDRGSGTANHLDHVHINVKRDATGTGALTPALSPWKAALGCTPVATAGAGTVVYPIANGADFDRKNWGEAGSNWENRHTGTDFSVSCGTPVVAATGGTVSIEMSSWAGPFLTKVSTGPTSLTTWYGHMQSVTVSNGDVVTAGQQIGEVGTLGNSTGCHLHFEVHPKNGSIYEDNINPTTWLAEHVGQPVVVPVGSQAVPGTGIRVIQANVKGNRSRSSFLATRAKLASLGPDIITWNEGFRRSDALLTPPGYATWRDPNTVWPVSESRGTAISWRTDRWTLAGKGRVKITSGPRAGSWDNRWVQWVLLRGADGTYLSGVSAHAMTNAGRPYGGRSPQTREAEYVRGMEKLATVVSQLSGYGPVVVGGDFNSGYRPNQGQGYGWGPQAVLGRYGIRSTFQALGPLEASYVDYIFFTPGLTATGHRTIRIDSDHPAVVGDLAAAR